MQALDPKPLRWFYSLTAAYMLMAVAGLVTEFYWLLLLPSVVLIGYAALYHLDKLFLFIAFCTPLAINLSKTDLGIGVSLPTEPILFGMMLIYLLAKWHDGRFDKNLMQHPITVLIMIHLLWMLITSFTSSMFLVSIKHFTARLWFIVVCYFLATKIFKEENRIRNFIWFYAVGMSITIIYTIIRHSMNAFTQQSAHWVMTPFYNDHTEYAAVLALFLPPLIGLMFIKQKSFMYRFFALLITGLVLVAIVLSYTRAAWLSIVFALGASLAYVFRIKTWVVVTSLILMVVGYQIFQSTVLYKFEKTKEYSQNDYRGHIKSITNIKTDASNVERINRWSCAWRMFLDKPFFGWGPGTYQFNYAVYQRNDEKTYISTNLGDKGNAHSEYLGPLSEQGFLGTFIFVALCITVLYRASRVYLNAESRNHKIIALSLQMGLITYLIHGFLNNFLDKDKASVPFWAFIAAITILDLHQQQTQLKKSLQSTQG
jgi:O-antigen ligase